MGSPAAPSAPTAPATTLRPPVSADAPLIHRLVRESGVLDVNSPYAYALLGAHFAGTSLVAEERGRPVGFVFAYRPPSRPESLFVWQVAVAGTARGRGLATALLRGALHAPQARDARYLEATVTPSNDASRRLFEAVARSLAAPFTWEEGIPAAHLGAGHEAERLFRAGPLEARP